MDQKTYEIHTACVKCQARFKLIVPRDHWAAYVKGALIQNSLITLTPAERELLISGYCDSCFQALFPEDSDEDQDADELYEDIYKEENL